MGGSIPPQGSNLTKEVKMKSINRREFFERQLLRCIVCYKEHKLQADYCSYKCSVANKKENKKAIK